MLYGPHCTLVVGKSGREHAASGNEAFACRGYDEVITTEPGEDVPWHWHTDFEAVLAIEGDLEVSVADASVKLAPGEALFINSGRPHAASSESQGHLRSVVFNELLVGGRAESAIMRRYVEPVSSARDLNLLVLRPDEKDEAAVISHLARAIDALEAEEPGFEIVVRDHLSQLVLAIWKLAGCREAARVPGSSDHERISLMCDFITAHFAEKISVRQIASAAGVSERECLRCFTREFGVSPSRYLQMKRLSCAAELLIGTEMDISEVGRTVGIPSASHFSELFRRDYRCAPRMYRARARSHEDE